MSVIRILPDQVANRIAAGEVIERPVAVVKELVDNSIDAGADRIRVQFKQGGKSYILVEDNGKGMAPDDALLSLERHATSKIQTSDDLFNIQTLGFRGEAIPSIASVSRFLMRTRPADLLEGTEVLVNGGKLIHRKETGMSPGTRIEVTHLFSSIPARRKFLKTDNTEASHIIQWMRLIAVAHPQVAFRLLSNERTLISLPNHEDLKERILSLWGRELETQLKVFEFETIGISASGFIGKAGVSRPSRQDIVTIVNGRPVESRTLGFAFTEAFHTHIPKGRYPLVFLHLKVDPSMIDVNIHPSKKEIKFKNETQIRTLVIQNVWKVLREPIQSARLSVHSETQEVDPDLKTGIPERRGHPLLAPEKHFPSVRAEPRGTLTPLHQKVANPEVVNRPDIPVPSVVKAPDPAVDSGAGRNAIETEWRFIGDYHRSYSLFERTSGLTLVHNSRALRRIGYEKILHDLEASIASIQREIIPTTLELDAKGSMRLKRWLPLLRSCGLSLEEFGRNFYRFEALPSFLEGNEALQLVEKWLHNDPDFQPDPQQLKMDIALLCCGKYRQQLELPLRREVAMDVLQQLLACDQPMVDPEGMPVIQHIPHRTFENFKSLEAFS